MSAIISVSGDKITETRIAQAINEIPAGIAVVDNRRRFRFRNGLFERQHSYLLLPAPVKNLEELMQAIDGRVTAVLSERGQDVSLHSYTYKVASRNGSLRFIIDNGTWYEYSFSPFGDYDTLIVCRNVTQEQTVVSELKDLRFRYEQFYERLPAMIHSINENGQIVSVSDRWLETLGYERHEVIGRKITQFISEKSRPLAEQVLRKFAFRTDVQGVRYHMLCKNGDILEVMLSAVPELDRQGKLVRSLSVLNPAQTQQARDENMQFIQELAMTSLNDMGDALAAVNRNGALTFINPVAERLTGWLAQEAVGTAAAEVLRFVSAKTRRELGSLVDESLETGQIINHREEVLLVARDQEEYMVQGSATPIWTTDGEIVGSVLVFRDVTREIKTQRKLAFYSQLDPLTRLPNRHTFLQTLGSAFEAARKSSGQFGLLFIDIDRFRVVNDLYGHAGGDMVLKQLADILRKVARDNDYIGRVAGDKFAVILRSTSGEAAQGFAEKFRKAIADKDFDCGGENRTQLTVSIGVTTISKASRGPQSALAEAEGACQSAKEKGRNRAQSYATSDESLKSHQTGMVWINQINESVRNDQMRLLSMPISALQGEDDERVRGEVLLRMVGSNGSLISPQQFLPAAEHYQVVESVDRWVVENVFETLATESSLERIDFLALNLSARSILNADFLDFVREQMQQYPEACPHLCFEIVESAVVEDLPRVVGFIEEVRGRGCRVALDDFGKQTSSFKLLRNLPADLVRIDGGYFQNLLEDPFNLAVVQSMNTLIHGLGMASMAEWVESQQTLERIQEMGLDYAQGFHVGEAQPLQDLLGGEN